MKAFFAFGALLVLFTVQAVALIPRKDRCTALAVASKASVDGSLMTTHNNDCENCDSRVIYVPAQDYEEGSMRPIYAVSFEYPRFIGAHVSPAYGIEHVDRSFFPWNASVPIGYIPQVRHTYAYIDGAYAIINENQVAIGESTCGAKLNAKPIFAGGSALLDVSALTRIALERAKTAREAIEIMGSLAEKYGYYGAEGWEEEGPNEEAGEGLTVADPNEAWVFHILPDDTGKSAVWVAQRVPDDHISALVNYFNIRAVDLSDSANFLASSNIFDVAIRAKLWDSTTEPFDFLRIYGQNIAKTDQPFAHRLWRVYDMVAPSRHFSPDAEIYDYPFSVKVDKPLAIRDVMAINRDHFDGTQFDLSQGPAGGPYGNPNRYDWPSRDIADVSYEVLGQGHFERAISLHRTAYSTVTQSRKWLPNQLGGKLWFGPHQPATTVFAPIYPGAKEVHPAYVTGHLFKYDRASAWWTSCAVGNWAERMWKFIIADIKTAQEEVEGRLQHKTEEFERQATHLEDVTRMGLEAAGDAFSSWSQLFESLITKFHDGLIVKSYHTGKFSPSEVFYPAWWLAQVGYFAPSTVPAKANAAEDQLQMSGSSSSWPLGPMLLSAGVAAVVTVLAVRGYDRLRKRHDYEAIPMQH